MIENGQDLDLGKVTVSCSGNESLTTNYAMKETPNTLMTEVTVSVKDENCKIIEKDIYYGTLDISDKSEFICDLIVRAITKIGSHPNGEAPEILVKTKTIWQN